MRALGVEGDLVALFNHMKDLDQFYNHTEVLLFSFTCCHFELLNTRFSKQSEQLLQAGILQRYEHIIHERVHPELNLYFGNITSIPKIGYVLKIQLLPKGRI